MKNRFLVLAAGVGALVAAGVFSQTVREPGGDLTAGAGNAGKGSECPEQPPREFSHTPYYTGQLFDAHLHLPSASSIVSAVSAKMGKSTPAWDKNLSYDYLICMFASERTRGAFGFHLLTKYSLSAEVGAAKALDKKKSGVAHFLMPTFINSAIDPSAEAVKKILEKNPALFKGMGEVKFFDGTSPDSPKAHPYYQLAEKYGLIVMMHPFDRHKDAVEKLVKQYPKVTFLFHGIDSDGEVSPDGKGAGDNLPWVLNLLASYPNVYYSMDSAPMWGPLGSDPADRNTGFAQLRKDFDSRLERLLRRWKGPIEAHPDRFLSGTDRWHPWHYDRDASALIIEFKRAFIGNLAPEVREKYAYKNAERLLNE